MRGSPRLTVDQVVKAIESELAEATAASPQVAAGPPRGADLAKLRELERRFRADPVGGRLRPLKRIAFWFVASAFDRQAKVLEALFDELEASEAAREHLARRLAAHEAKLASGRQETRER